MLRNAKKSMEGSEEGRTLAPPAPEAAFSPEGTAGAPCGGSERAGCVCVVACALPWGRPAARAVEVRVAGRLEARAAAGRHGVGGSGVRAWRRLGQVRKVQGQWQRR